MLRIELETKIKSTPEICFDLSRSIDLHKISTATTNEQAVAGTTQGLLNMNESVTWQATHFGVRQKLTSKITSFDRPNYFKDEQIKGVFKSIMHEHKFELIGDNVIMTDIFEFQTTFEIFDELFNNLILTQYMRKLLMGRNKVSKEYAESDKWKLVLNGREYL